MNKKPLVSIITITRNRANLIHRAIESVQNQTYKNYEHIIIDGASTDNTEDIIKCYNDSKIRYIKLKENISVPKSYWLAAKCANGKYLTALDDDDEYINTKIEKQINLIESLPEDYGFVYCWMSYYDDKTKKLLRVHKTELRGFIPNEVIEGPIVSGTPTLLIRKKIFIEKGGYKNDIGLISDWEFAARLCQVYKVDYVPESLVNVYINHGKQRMSNKSFYGENYYKNIIKFHMYFLTEFKHVFDKYPKKRHLHLYNLSQSNYYLNNLGNGLKYQFKLLRIDFSLKNLLIPLKVLNHKININK